MQVNQTNEAADLAGMASSDLGGFMDIGHQRSTEHRRTEHDSHDVYFRLANRVINYACVLGFLLIGCVLGQVIAYQLLRWVF